MSFAINWTEAVQISIFRYGDLLVPACGGHQASGFGARAHLLFVIT